MSGSVDKSGGESMKNLKSQIDSNSRVPWDSKWKRNQSKAQVFNAMRPAGMKYTLLDLQLALPHMTEGQIRGVLLRGIEAKRSYIKKQVDTNSPNTMRYLFQLTSRGLHWCWWAEKVGLVEVPPAPSIFEDNYEEEDDDDDEEELAWLGA